jgi:peptidyl-prolyl cis-trans isomerase A (cyclophilin A)
MRSNARGLALVFAIGGVAIACDKATSDSGGNDPVATVAIPVAAPQPSRVPWLAPLPTPTTTTTGTGTTTAPTDAGVPELTGDAGVVQVGGTDPLKGKWTLHEALQDLPGAGALIAKLDTTKGPIDCKLHEDKAPLTVANFVGLARGLRPWKNTRGEWVKRPAYDGTKFHRIMTGFMIQGGDPKGTGTGEPGYTIPDEVWPGATHDRAGQLCMANRGKNTNGAQFFITDGRAVHLDGGYTIFGDCSPAETIEKLAGVETRGDRSVKPTKMQKVTIKRVPKKEAPASSASAAPTSAAPTSAAEKTPAPASSP